ncbi:MAG: hypothetical protein AAFQ42_09840 [Pseudomonadota bacterium]
MTLPFLVFAVATGAACLFASLRVIAFLRARDVVAVEGSRSSHTGRVVQGVGIGFVPPLLIAMAITVLFAGDDPSSPLARAERLYWLLALGCTAVLAVVSFVDDVRDLQVAPRLAIHLVLAMVFALSIDSALVPFTFFLPEWIARLLLVLSIIAWINLYNFMDGIDGITVSQTGSIALTVIALLSFAATTELPLTLQMALLLLAAAIGFGIVNWHPARGFMGDVGSMSFAFLTGAVLVSASRTFPIATLALPALYYLADSGSTMFLRWRRGEKLWQAHRSHAYQVFVRAGRSHADACRAILVLNAWLALLALAGAGAFAGVGLDPTIWTALAIGLVSTAGLIVWFRRVGRAAQRENAQAS